MHDTDATLNGAEDDFGCFNAADSTLVPLIGCQRTDADFDGPEYLNTWPGSPGATAALVSTPILFTSPLFTGPGNSGLWNYHRVAFEADLPRIENNTIPPCQRHVLNPADPNPGQGCVNPPTGATFYPFFTTGTSGGACVWQEGGANIPGTTNTFGGSSTTAFGPLLLLTYPDPNPSGITQRFNNFRNILDYNPCPAPGGKDGGS